MAELRLAGCRSRPLVGYLKALGLLRVVGEQRDPGARLRWRGGVAELASDLDAAALAELLLDAYAPAPICSPWNGGSGFFPGDKKARAAHEAILSSAGPRLDAWRRAIAAGRRVLAELGLEAKPAPAAKPRLLHVLRARLPDDALRWLDACVVLGEDEVHFPPLLGSGGNDGRYDIAGNVAGAVVLALALDDPRGRQRARSAAWLDAALHERPAPLERMSLAHFQREDSPVNSPHGRDAAASEAFANPWDLVLAVEGCLLLAAGAARRYGAATDGSMAAPFTAAITGAGHGSAVAGEKGRAELWLPLWPRWAALPEVEALMREGRAQVGRRLAGSGYDFARAASELGVARGVEGFERYVVLERAGQSNLALPAGRVDVRARSEVRALRDLDDWWPRVRRFGLGRQAPASLRRAVLATERALFAFAATPTPATAGQALEALGATEHALAISAAAAERGDLRPRHGGPAEPWLEAADDGTPELALAVTLASLRDRRELRARPALRDYLHGTDRDERGRRRYGGGHGPALDRSAPPLVRLAALHARRHLDAARARERQEEDEPAQLSFPLGIPAPAAALAILATTPDELDLPRVLRLAGGLSLLDVARLDWRPAYEGDRDERPAPAFGLLALAWWGPPPGTPGKPLAASLGPRPGWAAALAAGQVERVLREAHLRLTMADLVPAAAVDDLLAARPDGRALAAALLLPPGFDERRRLVRRLTRTPAATETVPHEQGAPA